MEPGTIINGVPVGVPTPNQGRTRRRMRVRRPIFYIRLAILAVAIVVGLGTAIYNSIAGPHITSFYTVSEADYNAFDPSTTHDPPSETNSYPASTKNIAIYFDVEGAKSGSTKVTAALYSNSSGGQKLVSFKPVTATDDYMKDVEELGIGDTLPSGSYHLVLSIDGKAAQSHVFIVR